MDVEFEWLRAEKNRTSHEKQTAYQELKLTSERRSKIKQELNDSWQKLHDARNLMKEKKSNISFKTKFHKLESALADYEALKESYASAKADNESAKQRFENAKKEFNSAKEAFDKRLGYSRSRKSKHSARR